MATVNLDQHAQVINELNPLTALAVSIEVQPDSKLAKWLADLSPDTSWGDRKIAAERLGYLRNPEALPWLLAALPADPFWMVRYAIIQAVEMIGDPCAIPALQEVAVNDQFQVVRSYARKAIERLTQKGYSH